MRKTAVEAHYSCFMQKNGSKKQLIFEKRDHFENWEKNGRNAKAIIFAKWPTWVKN